MTRVRILEVQLRTDYLRPVAMPSVLCPVVLDWDTKTVSAHWLCVSRCLACRHAERIEIDMQQGCGAVHCSATPPAE